MIEELKKEKKILHFITNLPSRDLISIATLKKIIKGYFNNILHPEIARYLHPETRKYKRKVEAPKKIFNYILCMFAQRFGIFISEPPPPVVRVEVVRGCNFKCIMCGAWKFKLKFLTFDQVKYILHYFRSSWIFLPHAIGEPFLNKDIYEISRYAHYNLNFLIDISSNFSVINPERALDMGAYEIRASIDSINKEKFFELRHGNFNKVKENLVEILRLKQKQNKIYPMVSINTVISKLNIDEIEDILNFGLSLGVRRFHWLTLSDGYLQSKPHDVSLEDILNLRKILHKYEREAAIKFLSFRGDIVGYEADGYCFHAFQILSIDVEGNVYPCYRVLGDKSSSFGNIFSEPQKVFKNRSLFLRKFRSSPPEFCKRCELYYRKPGVYFYKSKIFKFPVFRQPIRF